MLIKQRDIPKQLRRQLIKEAGDKCANPGCSNWRTHIHHVKRWAIFKTHVSDDMIAVCPSCHDAIHNGLLRPSDDDLYQWKGIERSEFSRRSHIYAEPAKKLAILIGSITIVPSHAVAVFGLSDLNNLSFRVLNQEIVQLTAHLIALDDSEIVHVFENYVRVANNRHIHCDYRPGRFTVTVPLWSRYIPNWVVECVRLREPHHITNGRMTAIEIEVVRPGVVRVQGFWPNTNHCVVVTRESLIVYRPTMQCNQIKGYGEETRIHISDAIKSSLFIFS